MQRLRPIRPGGLPAAMLLAVTSLLAHGAAAADATIRETRSIDIPGLGAITADFGSLPVPEVRGKAGTRTLRLAFVRLHSPAENPTTPVVYLAGGPGQSSTFFADRPEMFGGWQSPLRSALEVCDVILFDQRGTGKSEPDMGWAWDGPLPLEVFRDGNFALRHALEMGRRARKALVEKGIDPDGYTSEESADDVDDLRRALGLERISLLGFSYGTHLALAVLRRHGEFIDRAVLNGVEGPDHTLKPPLNADVQMRKLAAMVTADPRIGSEIPDLYGLLDRVLKKLEQEPMKVTLDTPDGGTVDVGIGPFGLKMILRFDIGDASDLPVFPRLLWSIDQGDSDVLTWFVKKRAGMTIRTNGMSMLMDGSSGASPERLAFIESQGRRSLFRDVVNFPYPQVVEVWQPRKPGPGFREPLISTVPTLFLSGTLDWNSPPAQAEEVRWGFTNSIHLIVENAGHEQVLAHPEIQRALARFLRGDDSVAEIHAAYPPLQFVPLRGSDPRITHPSIQGP